MSLTAVQRVRRSMTAGKLFQERSASQCPVRSSSTAYPNIALQPGCRQQELFILQYTGYRHVLQLQLEQVKVSSLASQDRCWPAAPRDGP
jgi:hypothetical protein